MAGARGAKGTTRFLLVLTDRSVVTLSTAGRARISLKHGLVAPNPDDLISRNRHFVLTHLRVGKAERGARLRELESQGRESIFMLLSDA